MRVLSAILTCACLTGCLSPGGRLRFPAQSLTTTHEVRTYDVDGDGLGDFSLRTVEGRFAMLEYDDDQDGWPERVYRLSDYAATDLPHLIVLVDSIPYAEARERWERDAWSWFEPPTKVLPPFPTMSALIFSELIGAPPQAGAINLYYDRHRGAHVNRIRQRLGGDGNTWERRLHYRIGYLDNGLSFLRPRAWFRAELARAKNAFDRSPDRVTLVYLASSAGMLSKYGRAGLEECLDGIKQLCLQILYERRGAVRISIVSDHGHTLRTGRRFDVERRLKQAGFQPRNQLQSAEDVVVELDGLVNYAGIHTRRAADVARALAAQPEVELTLYQQGERIVIESSMGAAIVEQRGDRYRYQPLDADVLGYLPVIEALSAARASDADGFVAGDDWLAATQAHRWPNAPERLWRAFHGAVVNTPDVMLVTEPGFFVGKRSFALFVDMASTHGGLDQADSAAVLFTMTPNLPSVLRTGEVLETIEPRYDPNQLRR